MRWSAGRCAAGPLAFGVMGDTGSHSVLVVDDDRDICEAVQTVLELEGYAVVMAGDGAEALARLRAGARPCLIILDLMMPNMNGIQFREQQQRDPELRDIPVVVLSGDGTAGMKAAALGVEGLRKPVELEVLLDAVQRSCVPGGGAR
ncbi:MAG TPA: response regulator [Anaeromyxobacter sp.]